MKHRIDRRHFLMAGSALLAGNAWAANAYPNRPLRFILPLGPGSSGDTLGRALAEQLGSQLGQPVVVDNRGGAEGQLAMQALLSAPADGYTFGLISPGIMAINPWVVKNLSYKTADVRPLARIAAGITCVATGASSCFTSLQDLLGTARKQPDTVTLGSYGPSYRIPAIALGRKAGANFRHVRYKGYNQLVTDLVGGVIDTALIDAATTVGLVEAGKLRALAVTARERFARLPKVPTVMETGTAFDLQLWFGAGIHAQTPEPLARRLEQEFLDALGTQRIKDQVAAFGNMQLLPLPGAAFASEIAAESERNRALVAEIGGDDI